MLTPRPLRRVAFTSLLGLALVLCDRAPAFAQQSPWTGVVADETRSDPPRSTGDAQLWANALSGDGRFVVFQSDRLLVPGDTNGAADIFLRDRHTGALTRVSVSSSGIEANGPSYGPAISRDGRHLVFVSCATNLVVPESEFNCVTFVHDRVLATTTMVTAGPNGESAAVNSSHQPTVSADGRYVAFTGDFDPASPYPLVWLRDRDGDADGMFDEPGESTTTQVSGSTVGDEHLTWVSGLAISADVRWIAYSATAYDAASTFLGTRLFLHDRNTGTTVRVDRPALNDYGFSWDAAFSDTGELVYRTSVDDLDPADTSTAFEKVFVVNLATLAHTRVPNTLSWSSSPSISADGRYIVYMAGSLYYGDLFVFDRVSGSSNTISALLGGSLGQAIGIPSISADGTAIAFEGTAAMLVNGTGPDGVFVATAVDVTPSQIAATSGSGSYTFDVAVPASIAWTLNFDHAVGIDTVSPSSGSGPRTVEVSLVENFSGAEREHVIMLGSKKVTILQEAGLAIASPNEGPAEGGTAVTISGSNFEDGATVTIGGTPATNVTWVSETTLTAVTPPHAPVGWMPIVVTNPGGPGNEYPFAFRYFDTTPPEVTPSISGTIGTNDWYVSDVTVTWTVADAESAITGQWCDELSMTSDGWEYVSCTADSAGGSGYAELELKRDATAPTVGITSPEERTYLAGESVALTFDCGDDFSGIVSCSANQSGTLDTSAPGTFTFTVTAVDDAGNTTTGAVTYTVERRTPAITWEPASATYPSGLGASQLNATADVPGSFTYSPAPGTVLDAGFHELMATFTPSDQVGYTTATASVFLQVLEGTPTITWPSPAAITYGTRLSSVQLNATHDGEDGLLRYLPGAGALLNAGTHTLRVTYLPLPPRNYAYAEAEQTITVLKANPTIAWGMSSIVYGTALSASQLNGQASVAGTFSYDMPAAGTVLDAGTYTFTATFTPTNQSNYNIVSVQRTLVVYPQTVIPSWPPLAPIVYGTALGVTQLNATPNVPGIISYSPAAGTVLGAGSHSLLATFTPDSANYASLTIERIITVAKATPAISWNAPSGIVYGTALSSSQLNASSSVAGSFAYLPAAGTVLDAGTHTLSSTFTSSDPNYHDSSAEVNLNVAAAAATITWPNPTGITYGTALGGAQLSASGSVDGSLVYAPAAGTVLNAGTHVLSVTFTPASSNYAGATATVTIVVGKANPTITWPSPAGITYGTAMSGTQLNATASVAGSFVYSPAAGTVPNAGTQTLSVTFTPSDAVNYHGAGWNVSIQVSQAATSISWSNPASITYGPALSGTQLNATGSVAGTLVYTPAAGTVLGAGTHTLSVTLTPADSNHAPSSTNRSITVSKKALTVRTVNSTKVYGQALPAFTISGTGFVNGDTVASLGGTPSFSTSATATSAPGNYNVTPSGLTSANYTITFAAGTLTISKASTTLTLATTPSPSVHNQTVQIRATVAPVAPGAGTPTGSVQFRDNGVLIGTASLVNGVATLNKSLKRGSHPLTATYAATTNFNGSSGAKTHQVN